MLRLDTQVIETIEHLGDPLTSQIVTERMLRPYIGLPFKKQKNILKIIRKKTYNTLKKQGLQSFSKS